MFAIFTIILCLSLFPEAMASEHRFSVNEASFSLNYNSEKWRSTKGLFGLPLVLSGPVKDSFRPIISVTPTPLKKVDFDKEKIKANGEDYKRERNEWLREKNGVAVEFDRIEEVSLKETSGYRVGYRYKINDVLFSEASFYLVCDNRLYHLKYLIRQGQEKHLKNIDSIIRSFRCF